ncbi:MAG: alpha-glucosidase [Terracidiphilus sp.]|nr:alpha-glucosidase [Terracidiphilus sp.]MDR3776846.1 alpha-glucosidase [Terracidiphilus sp.]
MNTCSRNTVSLALSLAVSCGALCLPMMAQKAGSARPSKTEKTTSTEPWWKHAVLYEIYPRSFQDSNGDGIGDINGITSRLDYLKKLGVDAIWISPMFPSPQVDFGYDISNYEAIDPQYGTMADLDRLIAQASKRKIRVIMDMVLNHTSDKHPWFLDAASSRTNPKHDWYVWNDGKPGTGPGSHEGRVPPNNWGCLFGGSAWEWVPAVHQYYYHEFYKQQPDLNWRNPAVEEAMFGAIRFWLDRGAAGVRLDAIPSLFEDSQLRDEPEVGGTNAHGDPILARNYTDNLPEDHEVIRRLRAMVSSYPGDRVLIGETYMPSTAELDKWYGGAAHDELQLPMDTLVGFSNKFDATIFRKYIDEAQTQLHGSQPLLVFNNHDNVRSLDRYGDGVHNQEIAKVLATVMLTTRATALLFEGEEIGMVTTTPTRLQDVRDPVGITGWPKEKGRDGGRTPMQWDESANAGFTTANATPWLPVPPSYKTINVKSEESDTNSMLIWYKQLIKLRGTNPAIRDGNNIMLNTSDPHVLSWMRQVPGHPAVVVACNFTSQPQKISLDLSEQRISSKLVRSLLKTPGGVDPSSLNTVQLLPFGVFIGQVE